MNKRQEQDHGSLEVRRWPHRAAPRGRQVDAAERRKPGVDGLTKVARHAGLADNLSQDIAGLFFHGTSVFSRAHTQAAFHIIVKVPNRYAGHGTLRLQ